MITKWETFVLYLFTTFFIYNHILAIGLLIILTRLLGRTQISKMIVWVGGYWPGQCILKSPAAMSSLLAVQRLISYPIYKTSINVSSRIERIHACGNLILTDHILYLNHHISYTFLLFSGLCKHGKNKINSNHMVDWWIVLF